MHTVTADPDEAFKNNSVKLPDGASTFDSGHLDPEETFEYTFEVAGTYRYFCVPHEAVGMRGAVIVE
jgi:plastocyanin